MKHLNYFDKFNHKQICDMYHIKVYVENPDGSINYDANNNSIFSKSKALNFQNGNISKIPIKFNRILNSGFNCSGNILETLENSPRYITGFFDCSRNKLKTLIGGPEYVGGSYYCHDNDLKDMYGFPEFYKFPRLICHDNPVYEILNIVNANQINNKIDPEAGTNLPLLGEKIKFIKFLNEYTVIRNQDTVIESRLEDALAEVGINELPENLEFKNYKLI